MHVRMSGFGSLNGLQIVPPALVGIARMAFQSQGIPPGAVSDDGTIDPQALIALAFDTIEIRTRLTPPIRINLKDLSPNPEMQRLLNQVQPAVKLTGRAGTYTFAPQGIPDGIAAEQIKSTGTSLGLGIGAALLGVLVLGGVLFA